MHESLRIDKWLWAARFYKTRSLATNAVEGGHVQVNSHRVKASYRLKLKDIVLIRKSGAKQEVVVDMLDDRRGSAAQAHQLYSETEESIVQRELYATQRKALNMARPRCDKKPNKHDRKKIRKAMGKD